MNLNCKHSWSPRWHCRVEDALLQEKNDMPILNILDEGNLPINKSRPGRATNALLMGVLVFLGTLGWIRRLELKALLVKSLGD